MASHAHVICALMMEDTVQTFKKIRMPRLIKVYLNVERD